MQREAAHLLADRLLASPMASDLRLVAVEARRVLGAAVGDPGHSWGVRVQFRLGESALWTAIIDACRDGGHLLTVEDSCLLIG